MGRARPAAGFMMRCRGLVLLACFAIVSLPSRDAPAHDLTPRMGRPATERKHFQGDQFRRAGCPQCISPLAKPTESPHEIGYYVGGGVRERSRRGECRLPHEGVWGTDYAGLLIPKHVELGWSHGRRATGTGTYSSEGPRLIHRP